jgi:hypothetical protein
MIKLILGIAATIFLIYIYSFGMVSVNSEECSLSKYNVYTNLTGGMRFFNNCYVQNNEVITLTEKCSFFGIYCRDVNSYTENHTKTVCFKLNNGKRC